MSGSGNGHPAWEPLLAKIPESLHPIVKPVFIEFDNNAQAVLTAKNDELKKYEAYKQFIDNNVDPEWLAEAADFAYQAQENPNQFFERANEVWKLGYTKQDSQQQSGGETGANLNLDDPELDMTQDITKHPAFAQLAEQLNMTQQQLSQFTEAQNADKQQKEWDSFLKKQHDDGKVFDDDYVTALVANGLSFDQAFNNYNDLVARALGDNGGDQTNGQAGQEQVNNGSDDKAPVVMGGDATGSGVPQQDISFGNMKTGDLEDTVKRMLEAAANE